VNVAGVGNHSEDAYRPPAPVPKRMLSLGDGDLLSMLPELCFQRSFIRLGMRKRPIVIFSDPAVIKTVLMDESDAFPKSNLMIKAFEPLLGNGLLISNGNNWRRQRAMLEGAFSQMRVRSVFKHIRTAVEHFSDRICASPNEEISLPAAMSALALEVIYRTILSLELGDGEAAEIYRAFSTYQRLVPQATPFALIGRAGMDADDEEVLAQASRTLRARIGDLVERRLHRERSDQAEADVLQAIIEARDPTDGSAFTIDEIIDQVAVLFLAGHETSANSLTWAFFILSQQDKTADELRREADAAAPGRYLAFEEVQSLSLVRQVFSETLRLYPPAGFLTRIAARSLKLGDHQVECGSLIVISPWIIHRHQALWAAADRFIPDRFSKKNERHIQVGAFVPFGWGPRICSGRALALLEVPCFIAEIIRRFRIEVTNVKEVEPAARLTIQPKSDVRCHLQPICSR
jgi:cytochrome P450